MKQINRAELLDLQQGRLSEVRRSLHDIRRINTYLGGTRLTRNYVLQLLQKHRLQRATVLDVGTGLADIPQTLVAHAARQGVELQVIGLDNNARHLEIAQREMTKKNGAVSLLQADAFCLPLGDNAVDVVISSLFLHHFRPPQILELLREFNRVSRCGWVMNDIVRDYVPLIFFKMTAPIFARSFLTRHDGAVSIRRAYTVAEMQHIVTPLPNAKVFSHFPYRMSIYAEK